MQWTHLGRKQEQRFGKRDIAKAKNKQGLQSMLSFPDIRVALAHCVLFIRKEDIRKNVLLRL